MDPQGMNPSSFTAVMPIMAIMAAVGVIVFYWGKANGGRRQMLNGALVNISSLLVMAMLYSMGDPVESGKTDVLNEIFKIIFLLFTGHGLYMVGYALYRALQSDVVDVTRAKDGPVATHNE